MKFAFRLLGAALILVAAPALAQAPAPNSPDQLQAQHQEAADWLAKVGEAVDVFSATFATFGTRFEALSLEFKPGRKSKAEADSIRALVTEARAGIARSDSMLAAIRPPQAHRSLFANLDPARIVADAREQNASVLKLMDKVDGFADAIEAGKASETATVALELMAGAVLMIDNQRRMLEVRRSLIPADKPVHSALGIGVQIYRLMGASMRGWYDARFRGRPAEATAELSRELRAGAAEARTLVARGRGQASGDSAKIDAMLRTQKDPKVRAFLESGRRQVEGLEVIFVLGEDLARWAEANADISASTLVSAEEAPLMAETVKFEERLIAASRAQVAAAQPAP